MPEQDSGTTPVNNESAVVEKPVVNPAEQAGEQPGASDVTPAKDGENPDEAGKDEFVDDAAEPPVNQRKTAKDFIIARKNAKIAKLKAQQEAKANGENPESDESDEGGEPAEAEDDEISLDGLAPIVEEHLAVRDAQEIDKFLDDHPDFAPYRSKVERWIKHPTRRHLPVSTIFFEVAGESMLKMGAVKEREAAEKARATQAGGGSNREISEPIDWRTATPEQLQAEQLRVRQQRR